MARRTLHLISQAHLDPVWLWPWRDGMSETLTTMQSALDRMNEDRTFRFSRSSAITYRWARDADPRMFDEIRKRARQGRWEAVNGWICQPDCNIPSTESFVRHCLYGKDFLAREIGADVTVGYNVDSFGHGGGLPQILAKAGYRYYVFMRPHPHEMELPTLFRWEAADGSGVLTWRIPTGYCQAYGVTADEMEATLRENVDDCFAPGFDDGAFFFGVGNHGGGPTREMVERIGELRRDPALPKIRFSTLAEFFAALESSPAVDDVPVVRGELQHHAPGCYAATGLVKQLNRSAEEALFRGEAASVLADLAGSPGGATAADFVEPWWKTLFNQFHDILAGSSTEPCYDDARDQLGAARDAARSVAVHAAHGLARRIDTSGAPEGVLVLVNTLPWARKAAVGVDTFVSPHGDTPISHLADETGKKIPIQWAASDACFGPHLEDWGKLTAVVDLPAFGYRAFHMAHGAAPTVRKKPKPLAKPATDVPGLSRLVVGKGENILADPVSFVVVEDTSDTWGHGVYEWRKEMGRPKLLRSACVEKGPVVEVTRQWATWRKSEIILDIVQYRELDGVELRVRVNWQEKHCILKLEVPTRLRDVTTFAKVPGGVAEREPLGCEEPVQDWVALQGKIGRKTRSLGLVNDGVYSCDCLDGLLRMVVCRGVEYARHEPSVPDENFVNPITDQGWSERRYRLFTAAGTWRSLELPRLAASANIPAEYVLDSAHDGDAPWRASFMELDGRAALCAVKPAEDGTGFILRVQEQTGRASKAHLVAPGIGLEETLELDAWEIRSVRVVPGRGRRRARCTDVDLLEREV